VLLPLIFLTYGSKAKLTKDHSFISQFQLELLKGWYFLHCPLKRKQVLPLVNMSPSLLLLKNIEYLLVCSLLLFFLYPLSHQLTVDDDSINLRVMTKMLNKLGQCNLHTAESGTDALLCVEENDYDIVFMDGMAIHLCYLSMK
jgi:Response regulator receiver domain